MLVPTHLAGMFVIGDAFVKAPGACNCVAVCVAVEGGALAGACWRYGSSTKPTALPLAQRFLAASLNRQPAS